MLGALHYWCCCLKWCLLYVRLQAMVAQVSHDHTLLAERIARLTGPDGSARLEAALAHVRQQVAAELQAADDAASEASWETTSDAGRWVAVESGMPGGSGFACGEDLVPLV